MLKTVHLEGKFVKLCMIKKFNENLSAVKTDEDILNIFERLTADHFVSMPTTNDIRKLLSVIISPII